MPAEPPSPERRTQRLELLMIYGLCVVLLAALGVLWLQQKGYFRSAPVVEHSPDKLVDKPIELNRAEWWELRQIKGVSERLAKEIIKARDSRPDGFTSFEELREVRGIGEKRLEVIRRHVRLEPRRGGRQ